MNLEDTVGEIRQRQKKIHCMISFIVISSIGKFIEIEHRLDVTRDWGWGNGELLLNNYRGSL